MRLGGRMLAAILFSLARVDQGSAHDGDDETQAEAETRVEPYGPEGPGEPDEEDEGVAESARQASRGVFGDEDRRLLVLLLVLIVPEEVAAALADELTLVVSPRELAGTEGIPAASAAEDALLRLLAAALEHLLLEESPLGGLGVDPEAHEDVGPRALGEHRDAGNAHPLVADLAGDLLSGLVRGSLVRLPARTTEGDGFVLVLVLV